MQFLFYTISNYIFTSKYFWKEASQFCIFVIFTYISTIWAFIWALKYWSSIYDGPVFRVFMIYWKRIKLVWILRYGWHTNMWSIIWTCYKETEAYGSRNHFLVNFTRKFRRNVFSLLVSSSHTLTHDCTLRSLCM